MKKQEYNSEILPETGTVVELYNGTKGKITEVTKFSHQIRIGCMWFHRTDIKYIYLDNSDIE